MKDEATVKYDDLVKMSFAEIQKLVDMADDQRLVALDYTSHTDLSELLAIIPVTEFFRIEIIPSKKDVIREITLFSCELSFGLPEFGIGTIVVDTDWCLWQRPRFVQMFKYLLRPLYQKDLADRAFLFNKDQDLLGMTGRELALALIYIAKVEFPDQFRHADVFDPEFIDNELCPILKG
ncbi:MAG: hypothetical protein GY793_04660 [Proteobacteria bacterium]|nr:hypothetical protein [Pseudomonadota bacterium]